MIVAAIAQAEKWDGQAKVEFAGTSTLHDWAGAVQAQAFKADIQMAEHRPTSFEGQAEIKVAEMNTANDDRDENLRKAMKDGEYPVVVAKIASPVPPKVAEDGSWQMPVEVTLLGKTQTINGTVRHWAYETKKASFDLEFPISLEASGIHIPRFLLFIRVGDVIKVNVHIVLVQS
jgi:hypothetical protein